MRNVPIRKNFAFRDALLCCSYMSVLCKLLSFLPEVFFRFSSFVLGYIVYYGLPSRRRSLLNHLYNVFPDKSEKWRRQLAKLNCVRWVEMGLLLLVSSCWSAKKIRKRISCAESVKDLIDTVRKENEPYIILVPHLNLMEAITWLPLFFEKTPETHVVYRPVGKFGIDQWLQNTRERFGLKLLSRKRGFYPMFEVLKNGKVLVFLFDQSAGETGVLTTFFEKMASSTDLPGKCVEKYQTRVGIFYIERTGFWKGRIHSEKLEVQKNSVSVTIAANQWLEKKLLHEKSFYENWLWLHNRWKIQQKPSKRFCIQQKRNILPQTLTAYGHEKLPAKTRVWIRMPNWLGDIVMALPVLKTLKIARPDFELNFLVKPFYIQWLQRLFPNEKFHSLPEKGKNYWKTMWSYRLFYPEVWISFTHSFRSDCEAFLIGAPQRFGIRKRWPRLLLTHVWTPDFEGHQTLKHYAFFKHFGLQESLDLSPFRCDQPKSTQSGALKVGVFCGSENLYAKRWPEEHWCQFFKILAREYSGVKFTLFGTSKDLEVCNDLKNSCNMLAIENKAGQTTLSELCESLVDMNVVISNDTGGAHLANMLGVPLAVLYGPTFAEKTGPIFDAPKLLLKSPNGRMDGLLPNVVTEKIIIWFNAL